MTGDLGILILVQGDLYLTAETLTVLYHFASVETVR